MNRKREMIEKSNGDQRSTESVHFIKTIINEDLKEGKNEGRVHLRFPPEPNGYLHIGHAKAICLNFGLAKEFGGQCNLRFDDTNPLKESQEYIDAIRRDVQWLGFDWGEREYYASDYFEQLFEWAVELIKMGKAYVCDLTAEQIREYRGTLTSLGKESPYRNRSADENLDLFTRMKEGEFEDGTRVLRARIDMASPNLNMRDPVIYRILHATHPRTGDKWCIYPMYDWAHGQSDSIEKITHSICTLEFEDHRPLYDWCIETLGIYAPRQIEFARLNLSNTVMSKRKLLTLVKESDVDGWDDPRMPTISGMRRRGYTPESIRDFCDRIGVAKRDSAVDIALLTHCLREDLNRKARRFMGVQHPVKVVLINYPEDKDEEMECINNPEDPSMGTRQVPFSKELYIERDDFQENPPKKFYRLAPGREVRLRYAYYITCQSVVEDEESGEIVEIHCTYDPETRGGQSADGRKVKATLHWVSASHAVDSEIRFYHHLFTEEAPEAVEEGQDFRVNLNGESRESLSGCKVEPSIEEVRAGESFQFERLGYFCKDPDSTDTKPVFNRTVTLRDTWAKIQKSLGSKG